MKIIEIKQKKGAATIKPNIVVTSACDIPPAICFGSPVPNTVIAWNVSIIPITVPRRPRSGATAAKNFIQFTPQLRFPLTVNNTSSHSLSNVSTSFEVFEIFW